MTKCDEVALSIFNSIPDAEIRSSDEAWAVISAHMPGESIAVIDSVAWSFWQLHRDKNYPDGYSL